MGSTSMMSTSLAVHHHAVHLLDTCSQLRMHSAVHSAFKHVWTVSMRCVTNDLRFILSQNCFDIFEVSHIIAFAYRKFVLKKIPPPFYFFHWTLEVLRICSFGSYIGSNTVFDWLIPDSMFLNGEEVMYLIGLFKQCEVIFISVTGSLVLRIKVSRSRSHWSTRLSWRLRWLVLWVEIISHFLLHVENIHVALLRVYLCSLFAVVLGEANLIAR